jgi:hypothetical protein
MRRSLLSLALPPSLPCAVGLNSLVGLWLSVPQGRQGPPRTGHSSTVEDCDANVVCCVGSSVQGTHVSERVSRLRENDLRCERHTPPYDKGKYIA